MTAQLNNPYTCLGTNTSRILIVFLQNGAPFRASKLGLSKYEN